jgi:hypothetical protein
MNSHVRIFTQITTVCLCVLATHLLPAGAQTPEISNGAPFEFAAIMPIAVGNATAQITFSLPAGKRLVIRSIGGAAVSTKNDKYELWILSSADGTSAVKHYLPLSGEHFQDFEALYHNLFSLPVYINAVHITSGPDVTLGIDRFANAFGHIAVANITLSGYLIDVSTVSGKSDAPTRNAKQRNSASKMAAAKKETMSKRTSRVRKIAAR